MTATTTPETKDLLAGVLCPLCNDECELKLHLADCRTFACGGCDGEFDTDDLAARIGQYKKLIRMASATQAAAEADGE